MSAEPQLPTLGEFIDRANHHAFIPRFSPEFQGERLRYLYRTLDDVLIELPPYDDGERLTMNELETLCRRSRGILQISDFIPPAT